MDDLEKILDEKKEKYKRFITESVLVDILQQLYYQDYNKPCGFENLSGEQVVIKQHNVLQRIEDKYIKLLGISRFDLDDLINGIELPFNYATSKIDIKSFWCKQEFIYEIVKILEPHDCSIDLQDKESCFTCPSSCYTRLYAEKICKFVFELFKKTFGDENGKNI